MGRRLRLLWLGLVPLLALAWAQPAAPGTTEEGPVSGLQPPSAVRYADPAWYDLVAIGHDGSGIFLELGAVDDAGQGPLGLLQPILEVYVDLAEGGMESLLPGSTLLMPPGRGWELAYRVTGDGAWLWRLGEDGEPLEPVEASVRVEGRVVTLAWPLTAGEAPLDLGSADLYAISGVFDPFREDGWRPFERLPSPWAFSSAEPWPPVVDVLPGSTEVMADVRSTGRLPTPAQVGRGAVGSWLWWVLMGLGLLLGAGGVVWRARVGSSPQRAAAKDDAEPVAAEAPPVPGMQGETMADEADQDPSRPPGTWIDDGPGGKPRAAPFFFEEEPPAPSLVDEKGAPPLTNGEDAPPLIDGEDAPPLIDGEEALIWEPAQPAPAANEETEEGDEPAATSSLSTDAPSEDSRSAKRS